MDAPLATALISRDPVDDGIKSRLVSLPQTSPLTEFAKSFSSTNLPGTKAIKRPPLDTRSRSSNSMLNAIGTPKTPTKAQKKLLAKSPRVDSGKTLVDQFFTVNKEPATPASMSKRRFDSRKASATSNPDAQALDELPVGELVYEAVDEGVTTDADLTNYLLNIDALTRDILKQDQEAGSSLAPLNNTLDALVQTISERNREALVAPTSSTLADLHIVLRHLRALKDTIAAFCSEMVADNEAIKSKYRAQINGSVDKLNDLLFTLDKLESRFNKTRNRINDNKKVIAEQILQKIEVLEYVDSKFAEYSRINRKRRFKQFYIGVGVLVVMVSIYFGIYGFI